MMDNDWQYDQFRRKNNVAYVKQLEQRVKHLENVMANERLYLPNAGKMNYQQPYSDVQLFTGRYPQPPALNASNQVIEIEELKT